MGPLGHARRFRATPKEGPVCFVDFADIEEGAQLDGMRRSHLPVHDRGRPGVEVLVDPRVVDGMRFGQADGGDPELLV